MTLSPSAASSGRSSGQRPSGRRRARFSPFVRQVFLYLLGLIPAVSDIVRGEMNALGPNPVSFCLHDFGLWAFRFLLLSLAVSPLRRFARRDFMVYRRPLGLLAFTYAALHVVFYVGVTRHFDGRVLRGDFTTRPFLIFGMLTFLILLVLSLTSTRKAIMMLGRRWTRLHKLVYPAMCLACIHFALAFKTWHVEPFLYAALAAALLALRLVPRAEVRTS
ncbi:sulfoxide reductase heme-binding subunit YedZ [Acetobacter farinalis]|uniref:Protein-methionine-sulfoxide reductase heme-binding subunit MsrQ n=1 Tax=Acetobacter farinalis TaxID=1260984 RepID=A0ABT3Q6H6_9PROT|nr:protein-methionine-sulfoxide reductase heme-binding subunit MsrQ [Acetobacter farinalis]MCX2560877.1 sulfoxide reductase heme-binding subunit YedZ [Acetobacter farinalis]NHO29526.1 sulfoxide reductase heme-binding subunit YedZ [Acetobacter farinalis]